ncbi:hypothetical protein WME91_38750 [Sorangium sp. So ce269]
MVTEPRNIVRFLCALGKARRSREACRHAGDGGHMRMRAMALNMLARIVGGEEGAEARRRAMAIANELEDEVLRLRFERRAGNKG